MFETTMENIRIACDKDMENKNAKAYGVRNVDNEMVATLIDSNMDVYDLIDNLYEDKLYMHYDYLALVTTGWAAPLNSNGEVEGAPSQHPERRRVTLTTALDIENIKTFGSSIKFDDEPNAIHDCGTATGMLAEALESLLD